MQVFWPKFFPNKFKQLADVAKGQEHATLFLPELKKIILTVVPALEERTEDCGPAAIW